MSITHTRRSPAVVLPPVEKPGQERLAIFVAENLKTMILSGDIMPNDRLPTESALCEHFGVSRITIREAVQTLRALGLVESTRGRGTFVRLPDPSLHLRDLAYFAFATPGPIDDVFEVRALLETRAAMRAASAPQSDRAELLDLIQDMRQLAIAERPDTAAIEALDMEFHLRIATLSGNLVLVHLMRRLMQILAVVRARVIAVPGRPLQSWEEHKKVAESIVAGDEAQIEKHVAQHMDSLRLAMLQVTRKDDAVDSASRG